MASKRLSLFELSRLLRLGVIGLISLLLETHLTVRAFPCLYKVEVNPGRGASDWILVMAACESMRTVESLLVRRFEANGWIPHTMAGS